MPDGVNVLASTPVLNNSVMVLPPEFVTHTLSPGSIATLFGPVPALNVPYPVPEPYNAVTLLLPMFATHVTHEVPTAPMARPAGPVPTVYVFISPPVVFNSVTVPLP